MKFMSNENKTYVTDEIKPYEPNQIDSYSGFEDWLYPDNDKRRNRANQLMNQCADMLNNIANLKIETDKKLDYVSKSITDVYKTVNKVPDFEKISLSNSLWVVVIPKVAVTSIFITTSALAYKMGERMAVTYLLRSGRIGEAALTKLVGLPSWLKFGTGAASGVAGALVAVGIEVALDAIIGADTRSKLNTAIKDLAKPRIEFKYVELLSEYMSKGLESTMMEVERVKRKAKKHSYSPEKLETELKEAIELSIELYKELNSIPTVRDALNDLNKKDNLLNAWRDEDQKDPTTLTRIVEEIEVKYKNPNQL